MRVDTSSKYNHKLTEVTNKSICNQSPHQWQCVSRRWEDRSSGRASWRRCARAGARTTTWKPPTRSTRGASCGCACRSGKNIGIVLLYRGSRYYFSVHRTVILNHWIETWRGLCIWPKPLSSNPLISEKMWHQSDKEKGADNFKTLSERAFCP